MGMEDKIEELDINKILVVDDSVTNLTTAVNCLEGLPVNYDATGNASNAMEKIREAYNQKDKFDLILSDLSMETETAGLDVVREGLKHQTYPVIVTERGPTGNHGPATSLEPHIGTIQNWKRECWTEILDRTLDHLAGEGKTLYGTLDKFYRVIGEPLEGIAESAMVGYIHLRKRS